MKLKANKIKTNPDNPRVIKDDNFKKLVTSIKEFPEMTEIREVVVNKDYMILGGNMRYRVMLEAGWDEIPVRVVELTPKQEKEFVIKDNASSGDWDWDTLANEWDNELLADWDVAKSYEEDNEEKRKNNKTLTCPECGHEWDK